MITFHLQLFLVLVIVVRLSSAETINSVQIKDNVVPSKGSSLQLVCSISDFTSGTVISWYKTDTQDIAVGTRALVSCIPNTCIDPLNGYTYSSDNDNVYLNITDLSQSRDGKWWTCSPDTNTNRKSLQLVVYTKPQSLLYTQVPSAAQDLSVNSVTLECQTDCAYPAPTFNWYYTENGASRQQYSALGVASTKTESSCTDSEKLYLSTLTLAQYTQFTGNADKTVRFECGIPLFPGLTPALYTPKSPEIAFAVKVATITLKDGPAEVTSSSVITVTGGVTKTLICSPSSDRPSATIVWYIGNVEKQRSANTSFSFTPSDNDHDTKIYCKAFNIPPESQGVVSEGPILYVQVAPDIDAVVSPAILRENSSVNVNCNAKGGRPQTYTYTDLQQTWRDMVIPNTRTHLPGTDKYTSLALTSLQLQDTGNYTCHVNNGVKDSSGKLDHTGTVYVQVEVSPKILAQQTIFRGDIRESLNISVPFYSYPAAAKVVFTREGGGPIMNSTKYTISHHTAPVMTQFYGTDVILDGHTAVLQITDLEKLDFTNYTLMVTNSLGTNAQTILLSSQKPTPAVDAVNAEGINAAAIGGGTAAAVIVLLIASLLVVVFRRRLCVRAIPNLNNGGKNSTGAIETIRESGNLQTLDVISKCESAESSTSDNERNYYNIPSKPLYESLQPNTQQGGEYETVLDLTEREISPNSQQYESLDRGTLDSGTTTADTYDSLNPRDEREVSPKSQQYESVARDTLETVTTTTDTYDSLNPSDEPRAEESKMEVYENLKLRVDDNRAQTKK